MKIRKVQDGLAYKGLCKKPTQQHEKSTKDRDTLITIDIIKTA
jgi:hypothetical protein